MPKHNHVQTEQTTQDQNDVTQPAEPLADTKPLVGSLCPWTKYENSVTAHARVSEWEISNARRAANGLHGVLRVLNEHFDRQDFEGPLLLNRNVEGALFDAATHLLHDLTEKLENWRDEVRK